MSNQSKAGSQQQELSYSSSSSANNFDRLSNSLQYLDKIRAMKFQTQQKIISPLEKYIKPKQITFIDNKKLYGIVKVQDYEKLKKRVQQLEALQQSQRLIINQRSVQITNLQTKLDQTSSREKQYSKVIEELKKALQEYKLEKVNSQIEVQTKQKSINDLIQLNTNLHRTISQLQNPTSQEKPSNLRPQATEQFLTHTLICQTQTQHYIPTIKIPEFQPKLQQVLMELKTKHSQKISKPTLKEIIEQSLASFVKNLDEQYKLLQKQTVSFESIENENKELKTENEKFRQIIQENETNKAKLEIFRTCMTKFLDDTNQKVTQSIEAERARTRLEELEALHQKAMNRMEKQKNVQQIALEQPQIPQDKQGLLEHQNQQGHVPLISQRTTSLQSEISTLKQQNLNLLKTIGQYQYKWKNIEKIIQEKSIEDIPDEGTVGQLVKMSKLVKQAIKTLLQEL